MCLYLMYLCIFVSALNQSHYKSFVVTRHLQGQKKVAHTWLEYTWQVVYVNYDLAVWFNNVSTTCFPSCASNFAPKACNPMPWEIENIGGKKHLAECYLLWFKVQNVPKWYLYLPIYSISMVYLPIHGAGIRIPTLNNMTQSCMKNLPTPWFAYGILFMPWY